MRISVSLLFSLCFISLFSQGLSTSVLIPKGGNIGIPISPISIRGVGLGEKAGIESGFTFYSIPGLAVKRLPFETPKPLIGQSYSVLVPMQLFFRVATGPIGIKFLGGGFFNWHVFHRLNEGNLDRAILAYENWDAVTSDIESKLKSGIGWMAGLELEYRVNRQFSITTECQYLKGNQTTSLRGSYTGGDAFTFETRQVDYTQLQTKLQGIEIAVGVKLSGK